ncbi:MAG: hypothetical protein MOGMAGMI_02510 [Candidatus Omnitrophica bacterium]|nr:hypothetical protein [Candidatus Omnitrophota bacterium]
MMDFDSALTISPDDLSPRFVLLVEHLDLPEAAGDPSAHWDFHQLQFLNNLHPLTHDTKSRQIAWSWTAAADSVARGILVPRSLSIFVSINLDEAQEKIRYAKQIIEALDAEVRPRLLTENRYELEFANGSRLISHPCRPVRGKARATVYLDEFAHYPKDREIYTSALPVMTRGGAVHIGSSPLGGSGVFWEIGDQKLRAYPGYQRRVIPWWQVAGLCNDVEQALDLAPLMLTEERVRKFGSPRLIDIFENMILEDFQQEYECAYQDEQEAWIAWDEIKRNQVSAQNEQLWFRQARSVEGALAVIDEVADAVQRAQIEPVLFGGMDVGRQRNLSEIVLVGKSSTAQLPYRLGVSLANTEFDDQRAVARKMLERLPIVQMLIDRNGLGMQLAEQLHGQYGDRAVGVDFTNETKSLWAVELKVRMQRGDVPIPLERELSYQIHSIKKIITAAKNAVFDTKRNEKHHADKFWALALAVWAARSAQQTQRAGVVSWRK